MATDLQTRKIDASFRHIDADGDGCVDRDGDGRLADHELLGAVRDYCTSADPAAVGDALFGELPPPAP